ncbi:MAG: hypothetical protein H2174_10695 [Vampirovibrio sp.]|nr:hypothetical protein [Vampirovibrio sp.]
MMMMTRKKPFNAENQRWYQKDKNLLALVGRLQKMPISLMETYCNCVIEYIMELYQQDDKKLLFIESRSEKHQALIKSLDKKRWYDKNLYSYRAFNAMYLMDGLRRKELVSRLINTQALLHAYNERCLQCELQPSMEVLGHLLLVCVKLGEQEALLELVLLEAQGKLSQLTKTIN